jgi:hypothetical protein
MSNCRGPHPQDQPDASAGERQDQPLHQQLADDAPAACAEGGAHGDLLLPCVGTRQQQVRDVRGGDHENQPDDEHQQAKRTAEIVHQ